MFPPFFCSCSCHRNDTLISLLDVLWREEQMKKYLNSINNKKQTICRQTEKRKQQGVSTSRRRSSMKTPRSQRSKTENEHDAATVPSIINRFRHSAVLFLLHRRLPSPVPPEKQQEKEEPTGAEPRNGGAPLLRLLL
jgi:hypothetical protein